MLITPAVMPDEFVLGFWGRIHILNLLRTPNQTVDALIDDFALPRSRMQRILALALAAKTDLQSFIQNHTLIPAQGAVSQHFIGTTHGEPKNAAVILRSWKHHQKHKAHYCPKCVTLQREQWGFSYWKRSHQLLGVDWCTAHNEMLLSCSDDAFVNSIPLDEGLAMAPREMEREQSYWPILERYSNIMNAFLAGTSRIGVSAASQKLRPIAVARGISTSTITTSQYLSDIAAERLPVWWIGELFPSFKAKRPQTIFTPLDNTVRSGFAMPHAYALAMALLFDSSDEALASFFQK